MTIFRAQNLQPPPPPPALVMELWLLTSPANTRLWPSVGLMFQEYYFYTIFLIDLSCVIWHYLENKCKREWRSSLKSWNIKSFWVSNWTISYTFFIHRDLVIAVEIQSSSECKYDGISAWVNGHLLNGSLEFWSTFLDLCWRIYVESTELWYM